MNINVVSMLPRRMRRRLAGGGSLLFPANPVYMGRSQALRQTRHVRSTAAAAAAWDGVELFERIV